jgi:hypothetical protein
MKKGNSVQNGRGGPSTHSHTQTVQKKLPVYNRFGLVFWDILCICVDLLYLYVCIYMLFLSMYTNMCI